jgi:hypothetical protein
MFLRAYQGREKPPGVLVVQKDECPSNRARRRNVIMSSFLTASTLAVDWRASRQMEVSTAYPRDEADCEMLARKSTAERVTIPLRGDN